MYFIAATALLMAAAYTMAAGQSLPTAATLVATQACPRVSDGKPILLEGVNLPGLYDVPTGMPIRTRNAEDCARRAWAKGYPAGAYWKARQQCWFKDFPRNDRAWEAFPSGTSGGFDIYNYDVDRVQFDANRVDAACLARSTSNGASCNADTQAYAKFRSWADSDRCHMVHYRQDRSEAVTKAWCKVFPKYPDMTLAFGSHTTAACAARN